jgi:hypothetical protein
MNEYKTVLELAKDSVPTKYASAAGSLEWGWNDKSS